MSFSTDVSVREPEAPVLRVITTATVPERMGDFPLDAGTPVQAQGPFSALPVEPPYTVQDLIDDGYMIGGPVSPFIVSDTEL